jgi:hypothetical protein
MKNGPVVPTDICPSPPDVAKTAGLPLDVVENHLVELELRRVLVLRLPAGTRTKICLVGEDPRPNPFNTLLA